jgi:hypothetical protein
LIEPDEASNPIILVKLAADADPALTTRPADRVNKPAIEDATKDVFIKKEANEQLITTIGLIRIE